jgi:hypothetical protein
MVDKVALWQVFSEYFRFPCQFSFHRLLHIHHHLSSGADIMGQFLTDVPSGLSLTPPQETKKKTKVPAAFIFHVPSDQLPLLISCGFPHFLLWNARIVIKIRHYHFVSHLYWVIMPDHLNVTYRSILCKIWCWKASLHNQRIIKRVKVLMSVTMKSTIVSCGRLCSLLFTDVSEESFISVSMIGE